MSDPDIIRLQQHFSQFATFTHERMASAGESTVNNFALSFLCDFAFLGVTAAIGEWSTDKATGDRAGQVVKEEIARMAEALGDEETCFAVVGYVKHLISTLHPPDPEEGENPGGGT
jgi:hypothetical protein